MPQQILNVLTTQQRIGLYGTHPLFEHEKHHHESQGHMMVPSLPFTDLIVSHTTLGLSILKGPLYSEALRLHFSQSLQLGIWQRIGQGVFDGLRRINFPAHNQVPMPGLCFFTIP